VTHSFLFVLQPREKAMSVLIFADGIFDLNEALIRVAVVIAIPLGIVAVGGAIYLISKARKK
jgi:hypothetical protein